jgi:hypothetical protein
VFLLPKYDSDDVFKENETRYMGQKINATKLCRKGLKERNHPEELGVDGRKILK